MEVEQRGQWDALHETHKVTSVLVYLFVSRYVCMSMCLCACQSVHLPVPVWLSGCLLLWPAVWLSACPLSRSVCLFVSLSVCCLSDWRWSCIQSACLRMSVVAGLARALHEFTLSFSWTSRRPTPGRRGSLKNVAVSSQGTCAPCAATTATRTNTCTPPPSLV